jgi:polyhydroxybutyrate depolymerase
MNVARRVSEVGLLAAAVIVGLSCTSDNTVAPGLQSDSDSMQRPSMMPRIYDFPETFDIPGVESSTHELMVFGERRDYRLYRPVLPGGEEVPLMIVLHGGLGNANAIETTTGMNAVAFSEKFVVAYPEGTEGQSDELKDRRTWNAGGCCGAAVRWNVDDVGFISAMIDDIAARQPIDLDRVYVTGMSNGAMLAYRLACEIPDKVAAVIPVAGTPAVDDCSNAKEVPVLHIHGEADAQVPIEGGTGETSGARYEHRSVPETMTLLTEARDCSGSETELVDGLVERTTYHCAEGGAVQLVIVKGWGHLWPGGRRLGENDGCSTSFSASRAAWDFAKQYSISGRSGEGIDG